MATKIQTCVPWDNHILIIRPCAGGNTMLESITSPHQDLSSSLISTFLGFVFIGNLETTAPTTVLKLLKTWLSLGFLSRTSSALNPNHCASTPLSVRTAAFQSHHWLCSPLFFWHTPPSPQYSIHREQREGGRQKLLSGSYSFPLQFL